MREPQIHLNQYADAWTPNRGIYGSQLDPGDTIEPTDVYNSSNGSWVPAPCPGLTLGEGTAAVWVRPAK